MDSFSSLKVEFADAGRKRSGGNGIAFVTDASGLRTFATALTVSCSMKAATGAVLESLMLLFTRFALKNLIVSDGQRSS